LTTLLAPYVTYITGMPQLKHRLLLVLGSVRHLGRLWQAVIFGIFVVALANCRNFCKWWCIYVITLVIH